MPLVLDDLKGNKSVQHKGSCKKIDTWAFVNENFCLRHKKGDCNSKLRVKFKDGSVVDLNGSHDLKNCCKDEV